MSSANVVVVSGNLGRDAELKITQSGFQILSFSVAVRSKMKKDDAWVDRTDWIDCKMLGKSAESLSRYLIKGTFLVCSGRLQQETWEKDGQKRSKTIVLVESVSFGPKQGGGSPSRKTGGMEPSNDNGGGDDMPF